MTTTTWYGPFGEVNLTTVVDGVAYFGNEYLVDKENPLDGKYLKAPQGYQSFEMDHLYDDAERHGRKISGFAISEIDTSTFYCVQE